ncbi:hypothetical protein Fmac_012856 [Flemingia macrophylla]|uniref:galactinol--sucrose galactosyltransferase n=1 Tax=Flemingia macrophylla TaxID=520843 RepID=A0ABD1MRH2_9FABA
MTIKPGVRVSEGKLVVKGKTVLTGIPENVVQTATAEGVFVGAELEKEDSRHVVSLGTLKDVRFMACFRFKLWWMAQKMGDRGRDIPLETQFMILETKDGSHLESQNDDNQIVYTVFLPLIQGSFRACLQGNSDDHLQLCLESGDADTKASSFTHALFISAGTDPFAAVHDAFVAVRSHLGTFRLRDEKKLPGIVDCFGWCTWDAFYQEVTQEGVEAGIQSLAAGGTSPKFVIIDDGWQSVGSDDGGSSSLQRLTGIRENAKFRNKGEPELGIKNMVDIAKRKHGLTAEYHRALDASISRNFPDNGCIACMSQNTDALYCSKQTAVVRASDDFYPRDPVSHTIHIASVAYNSVFLGEIMLPDWDMFHSLHPAAEYHASARAISGGPLYVSDAPGNHDFELLRKMVLPDGSVLRPRLPGRPTKDCLFTDPARDGVSLLKIWNMNNYGGVLGVYNCQGAAWSATERKNAFHHTASAPITGYVRGSDVHFIADAADPDWNGDCALYSHRSATLVILPHNAALPVSLKVLEHELFAVAPVKVFGSGCRFAPIGLVNMFNAGGAIEGLVYEVEEGLVRLEMKGCGLFGAYSSLSPSRCFLGNNELPFHYQADSGFLTFNIDRLPDTLHHIRLLYS